MVSYHKGEVHSLIPDSIAAVIIECETKLRACGIACSRRHAELIIESTLNTNRVDLYINAKYVLNDRERRRIESLLQRRISGEPIQYITGKAPFFGREFDIGTGVFIPRFDTESLIVKILEYHQNSLIPAREPINVLDLCCGCGVIGLTIAAEIHDSNVTLIDNSDLACEYSRINAESLGLITRCNILKANALHEFSLEWTGKFDIIAANPPYIDEKMIKELGQDVQREPHSALTDGSDGLTFYNRWMEILPIVLTPGGGIFLELDEYISNRVKGGFSTLFSKTSISRDLAGKMRIIECSGVQLKK